MRLQEHKNGMVLKSFLYFNSTQHKPVAVAPAESGGGANGTNLIRLERFKST